MYEETITVTNTEGLHARPASKLVEIAGKYKSNIGIVHKGKAVNAKSILSIMGAGVYTGAEIVLRVEGEDEAEAAPVLSEYLNNLPD